MTVLAVLTVVYYTSKNGKEITFAKQNEILRIRSQNLDCSESYKKDLKSFAGCMPEKCGRFVSDGLVTTGEADSLMNIAQKGIALGGSDGGASILDLHSGALSRGRSFVNVYSLENTKDIFNKADLTTYKVNLHQKTSRINNSFLNLSMVSYKSVPNLILDWICILYTNPVQYTKISVTK